MINLDEDDDGRVVKILEFTVRNDKYRGIVIEKFGTGNNEYYFKYQDQPIHRHCDRMQQIIRIADVKRTKKIRIDVAEFAFKYFLNGVATFKSCPLSSINQQIERMCDLNINKEVAAMKRSITVAQNKSRKISERNTKILTRMDEAENRFQEERAKRINELIGSKPPGETSGRTVTALQGPSTPPDPTTPTGSTVPRESFQGQLSSHGQSLQRASSSGAQSSQGQSLSHVATVSPFVHNASQVSGENEVDDDFPMENIGNDEFEDGDLLMDGENLDGYVDDDDIK